MTSTALRRTYPLETDDNDQTMRALRDIYARN